MVGNKHLVAQPPIAGVHDEVADGPGLVVDDLAVGRVDVIPDHRAGASQMRIVAASPVRVCLHLDEFGLPALSFR